MRIEKISETQVKFILSKSDLAEHDVKLNELAYGSEKIHRLFQEMMKRANSVFDFKTDNAPLMVEAMPVGTSHVVIVVTKVAEEKDAADLPNNMNQDPSGYKTHGMTDNATYELDNLSIFSFSTLDDATMAAKRLQDYFIGQSCLYKCDDRYFLTINDEIDFALFEIELALSEYGERHISNDISVSYLTEHGELIISQQAVEKLAHYL